MNETEHDSSTLPTINRGGGLITFSSFEELWRWAVMASQEPGFVPKDYEGKPARIVLAAQHGAEVGLQTMQSLNSGAVINGRYTLYGDGFLAVCMGHPDFLDCVESFDSASMTATCSMRRRGREDVVRTFSQADAERAKLWGKQGPWTQYPQRMLQMRARGFAGRDCFADALRGTMLREEALDTPPEIDVTDRGETVYRETSSQTPSTATQDAIAKLKQRDEPEPQDPPGSSGSASGSDSGLPAPTDTTAPPEAVADEPESHRQTNSVEPPESAQGAPIHGSGRGEAEPNPPPPGEDAPNFETIYTMIEHAKDTDRITDAMSLIAGNAGIDSQQTKILSEYANKRLTIIKKENAE